MYMFVCVCVCVCVCVKCVKYKCILGGRGLFHLFEETEQDHHLRSTTYSVVYCVHVHL